jgi:hypothetical protein
LADAIYASERIPANLSAAEAADEFCLYMLHSFFENNEKERPELPQWFARYC